MSHPDQHSQSLLLQPDRPELQRHSQACVTVLGAHGRAGFLYKASVLLPAALSPAHMCMHALQGWCRLCGRVSRGMLSYTLLLESLQLLCSLHCVHSRQRESERVSGHC